ncbi:MAG: OsmC family protein [Acidimicrobiia bacterium]|nr:OsmC family protein [Acidimicrobiia bacterium]
MEARGINASGGNLVGHVVGEVEKDEGVLVIRRIHVRYELADVDSDEARAKVERVLGFHADRCPVARSIRNAIDITTELTYV